jgi:hypothetical protein
MSWINHNCARECSGSSTLKLAARGLYLASHTFQSGGSIGTIEDGIIQKDEHAAQVLAALKESPLLQDFVQKYPEVCSPVHEVGYA